MERKEFDEIRRILLKVRKDEERRRRSKDGNTRDIDIQRIIIIIDNAMEQLWVIYEKTQNNEKTR